MIKKKIKKNLIALLRNFKKEKNLKMGIQDYRFYKLDGINYQLFLHYGIVLPT